MRRTFVVVLAALAAFAIVVAIMLRLIPGPVEDSDYLVAGSIAVLVALLVFFLGWVRPRAQDVFFKKRPKAR